VKHARRVTEGPPSSGSRYRIVAKVLSRPVEGSYEITAFELGSSTGP